MALRHFTLHITQIQKFCLSSSPPFLPSLHKIHVALYMVKTFCWGNFLTCVLLRWNLILLTLTDISQATLSLDNFNQCWCLIFYVIKHNFQSAPPTVESSLTFLVWFKKCNFCNFLHELNSKFHVVCHNGCKASCFSVSDRTWWYNLVAVKIKETIGKRIQNASKIS